MHLLSKLFAAGLAGLLAVDAQAAILTYRYTARIDSIVETDMSTGSAVAPWESSFAGPSIRVGDLVTGILRYDTAALLIFDQIDPDTGTRTMAYEGAAADFMSFDVAGNTFSFYSDPPGSPNGTSYVRNADSLAGSSAPDQFERIMYSHAAGAVTTHHLSLLDVDGTAFQDGRMPARLDPALFESKSMFTLFRRLADDREMMFESTISSFESIDAPVPEPGVLLLLAAGAGGLLAARRRARPASGA